MEQNYDIFISPSCYLTEGVTIALIQKSRTIRFHQSMIPIILLNRAIRPTWPLSRLRSLKINRYRTLIPSNIHLSSVQALSKILLIVSCRPQIRKRAPWFNSSWNHFPFRIFQVTHAPRSSLRLNLRRHNLRIITLIAGAQESYNREHSDKRQHRRNSLL